MARASTAALPTWGHAALLILAPLALTACSSDSIPVQACETAIKAVLRSPSTYRRVEANDYKTSVYIQFDAANAFGTPIRSLARCEFEKPDAPNEIDLKKFSLDGPLDRLQEINAEIAVIGGRQHFARPWHWIWTQAPEPAPPARPAPPAESAAPEKPATPPPAEAKPARPTKKAKRANPAEERGPK